LREEGRGGVVRVEPEFGRDGEPKLRTFTIVWRLGTVGDRIEKHVSETLNASLTTANRERGGNQIQCWRAKTRAEKRKRALAKQGEAKAKGKAGGGKVGGRGNKGANPGEVAKVERAKGRREAVVLEGWRGGLGAAPSPLNQDSSTGLDALSTQVSSTVTFWLRWCLISHLVSIDAPVVRRSLVRIAQMFGLPSSRPTTTSYWFLVGKIFQAYAKSCIRAFRSKSYMKYTRKQKVTHTTTRSQQRSYFMPFPP